MYRLLVGMIANAVACAIFLPQLSNMAKRFVHERPNYRGQRIPLSGGAMYLAAAVVSLVLAPWRAGFRIPLPWAVLIAGFAAAGLIDDIWGKERGGGFRGHLRELLGGRPTTGSVKAMLGGLTALLSCWLLLRGGEVSQPSFSLVARIVLGAVLVALTANLVNLLDVRPGRAAKVCALAFLALAVWGHKLWTPVMLGAVAVVGWADVRERALMGDLGANLLGALIGLSLVALLTWPWQCAALAIVAAITVVSEVRPLTGIIEGNRVLRAIDMIGRLP